MGLTGVMSDVLDLGGGAVHELIGCVLCVDTTQQHPVSGLNWTAIVLYGCKCAPFGWSGVACDS
jgi:hypothetical protein